MFKFVASLQVCCQSSCLMNSDLKSALGTRSLLQKGEVLPAGVGNGGERWDGEHRHPPQDLESTQPRQILQLRQCRRAAAAAAAAESAPWRRSLASLDAV